MPILPLYRLQAIVLTKIVPVPAAFSCCLPFVVNFDPDRLSQARMCLKAVQSQAWNSMNHRHRKEHFHQDAGGDMPRLLLLSLSVCSCACSCSVC